MVGFRCGGLRRAGTRRQRDPEQGHRQLVLAAARLSGDLGQVAAVRACGANDCRHGPATRKRPRDRGWEVRVGDGVDASRFDQPAYDNSSVGASSAELLRRLNGVAPDLQRHHYRWGIKDALARLALIGRAEQEPSFGLTQPQQDWVCERADRMIEQIRVSPVRVVGDLADLRPAREARTDTVEPADTSDADLLATALVGLGGMAKIVADLWVEQERQRYDVDSETSALAKRHGETGLSAHRDDEVRHDVHPGPLPRERLSAGCPGDALPLAGCELRRDQRAARQLLHQAVERGRLDDACRPGPRP